MSEHWHAFDNRKEARQEEEAPSGMGEGNRGRWRVKN